MNGTTFGTRSARNGAISAGLALVLAIESIAIHLFVASRVTWLAWTFTSMSVAALAWIALDWRAMGRSGVTVHVDTIDLRIGRRWTGTVPRDSVVRSLAPEWRHIPEPGTDLAHEYRDLTSPAEPNVMLVLDAPIALRGPAGIMRRVRLLALHADEPAALLEALGAREQGHDARIVVPVRAKRA
jgi:hypothetical protein